MTEIVTLAETKAYLHVDSSAEDATIGMLIAAATEAVLEVADAWDGEGDVPNRLKLAVLARVATTFDNRASVRAGDGEDRLVLPLRKLDV